MDLAASSTSTDPAIVRGRYTSLNSLHIIVKSQLVGRRLRQNVSQVLRDVTASQVIRSTRNDHI